MQRSLIYAAGLAGAYAAVAGLYQVVSADAAAAFAEGVEDMRRIDTLKGVVFVAITTGLTFVGALLAMRRIERDAAELVRRERALVATQGKVFAGVTAATVAHDANNVLTALLGQIELLAVSPPTTDPAAIERLRQPAQRLLRLNRRLMAAAADAGPHEPHYVDLAAAVRDSVDSLRSHEQLRGCHIDHVAASPSPSLALQPLLLDQILGNLVLNAAQATQGRGRIRVEVGGERGSAWVAVHDDGPGVPPDRRADLFVRLQSTTPGGSGLGLFSAHACARALGGSLAVGDSPLGGACFRLGLPLPGSGSAGPKSGPATPAAG